MIVEPSGRRVSRQFKQSIGSFSAAFFAAFRFFVRTLKISFVTVRSPSSSASTMNPQSIAQSMSNTVAPPRYDFRSPATFLPLLMAIWLAPAPTTAAEPSQPSQPARHLFLDPAFLAEASGVELRVNPAERRELVIRPDRPWEKRMISLFLTVLDEGEKLRMWYICRDADNVPNVAYAESSDGVHWTKPDLGIVDYHGSKQNNLVGIPFLEGNVYRDPRGAPGAEYIYVTNAQKEGVVRHYSSDGLRWKRDRKPLLPFRPDTQNITFWDERLGRYVIYLRAWDIADDWNGRLRKVVRLELDDLTRPADVVASGKGANPTRADDLPRFTDEAPTVLAADASDPPNSDVYNISVLPYPLDPHWYVGFPSWLLREKNISDGRLEVQFVGSRDGVTWHRYDRAPYAPLGPLGGEAGNMTFMGPGVVHRGDELWQYGAAFRTRHGDVNARIQEPDGFIYRYVQRVDGFVSADFLTADARCLTQPVKVDGSRLILNVDSGALGTLRVALVDAATGEPLPGYSFDDCRPLRTNSLRAAAVWKGGDDLTPLLGRQVRPAFQGNRTKLFSFYFETPPKPGR